MGNLVFQATLGGQVNLVGPNTASTFNIAVPAVSGTMVTTGDTGTVTNTMLAGSIANAKLLNSSVTIGSTAVSLGATVTAFAGITTLAMTGNLTLSGGTANGVAYLNGSNVVTTGTALTFDGTTLVSPSHTTNTSTTGSTNKGPLNYGTLNFSDTGIVQSAQTSVNSYFQNVIQNTSNGASASAEYIAYNDQGTATTNYATVGINSSGYSGTGSINAAGYGYFLSASTDLVLGTIGANGIHFTTNSSATDALAISSAGAVSLPGGTANGVAYLNGSKVVTTGSALTFDGTNLTNAQSTASPIGFKLNNASASTSAGTRLTFQYNGGDTGYVGNQFDGTDFNNQYAANRFHIWLNNGSEQMRLTSTGLGIGTSSPNYSLTSYKAGAVANYLQVASGATGSASGNGLLLGVDSSGNSVINAQGAINLYTYVAGVLRTTIDSSGNLTVPAIYTNTTASVSYVAVSSAGLLQRGGVSALKYKQYVRDLENIDVDKIRAVRYKSKCENDDQTKDHFGVIADEVDAAGIKELVNYDVNGEVEGFQYERLTVVLLKEVQSLRARLKAANIA